MVIQSSFQIVFDTATIEFQNNRIFDRQHAAKFPGALTWAVFSECVKKRGWKIMTSDMYLIKPEHSGITFCISEMVTPFTKRVLATGAVPFVILSGESPNVAWNFYHNIGRYSCPYRYAFFFRGAGTRVKSPTCFRPLYWPNTYCDLGPALEWNKRQLLGMVASNKRRILVNEQKPLKSTRRLAKRLMWEYLRLTDPIFRFEDLYHRRIDAICYFAGVPGFKLFGTGWDQQRGLGNTQWQIIRKLKPVSVEDKLDTLRHFRFALCFENCVFPGYVTEKVFDCFLAGCVPVYFGAPDITDFIPRESFIDFRKFGNYAELDQFLREMSEPDFQKYTDAARVFLGSSEFEKFTVDYFVNDILNVMEQEFENG
jgi:hypothetical protein